MDVTRRTTYDKLIQNLSQNKLLEGIKNEFKVSQLKKFRLHISQSLLTTRNHFISLCLFFEQHFVRVRIILRKCSKTTSHLDNAL